MFSELEIEGDWVGKNEGDLSNGDLIDVMDKDSGSCHTIDFLFNILFFV